MVDRLVVIPGRPECGHFAAYPMVQVAMNRWRFGCAGTWHVQVFVSGLDFIERIAVMDDFGTLVEVPHG